MTSHRTITTAVLAIAALAFPATAAAATSSSAKKFSFTAKEARLAIANLPPIPLDTSQVPVGNLPKLEPISITGTVTDAGTIAAPASGVVFPSLQVPVPQELIDQLAGLAGSAGSLPSVGGFDIAKLLKDGSLSLTVSAAISPAGPASGTVVRDTGAINLRAPLDITVGIKATVFRLIPLELIRCGLTGLSFDLSTAGATMPSGTKLDGSPYSATSKVASVAGVASVPAPKCTGLLAGLLGDALDGLGTSLGQVGLGMEGDVVLPPPAVVTLTSLKTVKVSTAGKVSAKVACSRARACKGTLAVAHPGGSVIASKSFTLSAGRSTTVSITLPKSMKTVMKTTPKMDAVFRVAVTAGSGFSKPVALQRPLSWR